MDKDNELEQLLSQSIAFQNIKVEDSAGKKAANSELAEHVKAGTQKFIEEHPRLSKLAIRMARMNRHMKGPLYTYFRICLEARLEDETPPHSEAEVVAAAVELGWGQEVLCFADTLHNETERAYAGYTYINHRFWVRYNDAARKMAVELHSTLRKVCPEVPWGRPFDMDAQLPKYETSYINAHEVQQNFI